MSIPDIVAASPEVAIPDNVITKTDDSQTANSNLANANVENANLENANIPEDETPPAWEGDLRFFQSGAKAGKLKPSANVSGIDSENSGESEFAGLKVDALKATASKKKQSAKLEETPAKLLKAEKKANEARIAAALYMRMLDVVCGYISGGEFGADFTPEQRKERNQYRADLDTDAQTYFTSLDIPMHPALVLGLSSMAYVAAAFNTPKGEAKVASLKSKLIGSIIGRFFR